MAKRPRMGAHRGLSGCTTPKMGFLSTYSKMEPTCGVKDRFAWWRERARVRARACTACASFRCLCLIRASRCEHACELGGSAWVSSPTRSRRGRRRRGTAARAGPSCPPPARAPSRGAPTAAAPPAAAAAAAPGGARWGEGGVWVSGVVRGGGGRSAQRTTAALGRAGALGASAGVRPRQGTNPWQPRPAAPSHRRWLGRAGLLCAHHHRSSGARAPSRQAGRCRATGSKRGAASALQPQGQRHWGGGS